MCVGARFIVPTRGTMKTNASGVQIFVNFLTTIYEYQHKKPKLLRVEVFLAIRKGQSNMAEYKLLIDGKLVGSSTGKTIEDISPATGETVALVPESTLEDMNRAVAAARTAFNDGRWSELMHGARAAILEKLAVLIEEHNEELATLESLDTGKPIKLARDSDIPFAADNWHFFAGAARHLSGSASSEYTGGHTSI